jgi:hypothetical protein
MMNKQIIWIFLLLTLVACKGAAPQTPPALDSAISADSQLEPLPTPSTINLYISATMHIESESDSWPVDANAFLSFLQQTISAGLRWSIGGDVDWLEGAENAQEIVQRSAAMGVQWDIHAHNTNDFAREASILASWGVAPTSVVNGFRIVDFDDLQAEYTDYGVLWSPRVIWGGVHCVGHGEGCDDFSVAVYRPASGGQYNVHDPEGQFIKLGGGNHQLAGAENLAAQIAQGQHPYPVIGYTIMVEPETLRIATSATDDVNAILAFVQRMNAYPFVRWATIEETVQAWVAAGEVAFQIQ